MFLCRLLPTALQEGISPLHSPLILKDHNPPERVCGWHSFRAGNPVCLTPSLLNQSVGRADPASQGGRPSALNQIQGGEDPSPTQPKPVCVCVGGASFANRSQDSNGVWCGGAFWYEFFFLSSGIFHVAKLREKVFPLCSFQAQAGDWLLFF